MLIHLAFTNKPEIEKSYSLVTGFPNPDPNPNFLIVSEPILRMQLQK